MLAIREARRWKKNMCPSHEALVHPCKLANNPTNQYQYVHTSMFVETCRHAYLHAGKYTHTENFLANFHCIFTIKFACFLQ